MVIFLQKNYVIFCHINVLKFTTNGNILHTNDAGIPWYSMRIKPPAASSGVSKPESFTLPSFYKGGLGRILEHFKSPPVKRQNSPAADSIALQVTLRCSSLKKSFIVFTTKSCSSCFSS